MLTLVIASVSFSMQERSSGGMALWGGVAVAQDQIKGTPLVRKREIKGIHSVRKRAARDRIEGTEKTALFLM
jgi:hypothetical protein